MNIEHTLCCHTEGEVICAMHDCHENEHDWSTRNYDTVCLDIVQNT